MGVSFGEVVAACEEKCLHPGRYGRWILCHARRYVPELVRHSPKVPGQFRGNSECGMALDKHRGGSGPRRPRD